MRTDPFKPKQNNLKSGDMKLQLCLAMVFQLASKHRLESKLPKGRREEAPLITMIFVHHEIQFPLGGSQPQLPL